MTMTDPETLAINIPEVVSELKAAFLRYQDAVDSNDVATMNELFLDQPFTVRFGPNGTLVGHQAIAGYRQARSSKPSPRTLRNTVITTFGRHFAATNTESTRAGTSTVGRQSQTWVRTPAGWRIAAAHVSDQP
jgi:DNA replication protein DnaC